MGIEVRRHDVGAHAVLTRTAPGLIAVALAFSLWACAGDGDSPAPFATATAAPPTAAASSSATLTSTRTAVPTAPPTPPAPTLTATPVASSTGTPSSPLPSLTPSATEALLAPPDPEAGFQLIMTGFDVPIGGETEVCQLVYLPNEAPIDVDSFEVAMPEGSHHFVVWSYNGVNAEQYPKGFFKAAACNVPRPNDSMNVGMLVGAGTARARVKYPDRAGVKLQAHHPVLLNAHYVNATGAPLRPTVYVNVYYAKQPVLHPVESLTAIDYKIFVPPGESRTTTARFTMPFDAYFLNLSSHMHKRGDLFSARIVAGEVEEPDGRISSLEGDAYSSEPGRRPAAGDFYRSLTWANPTIVLYDEPRLYRQGTVIEFDCTQHNDKEVPLGFGVLANDEMCILTGLYYRAEGAPAQGTRIPGCLPQATQLTCYAEPQASAASGTPVCGNGRREGGEECDLGLVNGTGACSDACALTLIEGMALGTRRFPIVFSGPNGGASDFLNSVTRSSAVDPTLGVVSQGALEFRGGSIHADGSVTLSQDAEVRIGFGTLGGIGSTCVRLVPAPVAGTLHCRGGAGVDLSSELDNLDRMATPMDLQIGFGRGGDGGPGSALLLLSSSIASIGGAPGECLTRDWSADPAYPLPYTTGTSTGTITNADGIAGNNLVMSATGESFDCARWSDEDGPGVLQALTLLSPNTMSGYNGDVIAQLTLAGHDTAAEAEATPTPTPSGTEIGGEFAAIADDIFSARCALPSCHSSQARSGDLNLERNAAYDQLVDRAADNAAARAAGLLRVSPGDAEASFLLRKLTGTLAPDEGTRMPQNAGALAPDEIERIRAWITAGATPK